MDGLIVEIFEKDEDSNIIILDFTNLSDELKNKIDEYIVGIWNGNDDTDIYYVKKEILKYLESKDGERKIGAIAEFFIHLYLNMNGYSQYFLFQNLEEDSSYKKGFDGLYGDNNEIWLAESKSTEKIEIKHYEKIREAYKDLKDKVEGNSSNDPWKNAYNHASHRDVFVPENVLETIKKLRYEYVDNRFHSIEEFNIIPCSTRFTDSIENKDETKREVKDRINNFEFNKIKAICINNKVADMFMQYLRD